ncbi:MAG: hypothetical protein ACU841_08260 [Gammaproteobacteria bacterium]
MFSPKDFIETEEGLLFAVVASHSERSKVLCFLRYVNHQGKWRKLATEEANVFLHRHFPSYLHYSPLLDARMHAVPTARIVRHHCPRQRFRSIMQSDRPDAVERDLFHLGNLFRRHGLDLQRLGVTGSLLVGVQNEHSDIDLVCYDRSAFHQCRTAVRELIALKRLRPLSDDDWQTSYRRRDCSIGYDEYVWHERRKYNKAMVNGRKFDLNLVEPGGSTQAEVHHKMGPVTVTCRILDDRHAFDYPAVFRIEHESIDSVVCFTATYIGQAFAGELVEVSGMLEQTSRGSRQIVVGSSREATGEHIRVINA